MNALLVANNAPRTGRCRRCGVPIRYVRTDRHTGEWWEADTTLPNGWECGGTQPSLVHWYHEPFGAKP